MVIKNIYVSQVKEGEFVIEQLMVKDYILFEYALIDFQEGMTVITGETGAGKSLLIDAIHYLCGARIQGDIVRKPAQKCTLQMVLGDLPEFIVCILEENGFEIEDSMIITRTITNQGKSTIRINQQVTTLSFVRKIVLSLIDIHSQMDTIQLLDPNTQLELLDQYANTQTLVQEVKDLYAIWHEKNEAYQTLKNQTFSDDELEYYTSLYNEIEQSNIQEDELEFLQNTIKEISQKQDILEALSSSIYHIDQENGIMDLLYTNYKLLQKQDALIEISQKFHDLYYQCSELCDELKQKKESYMHLDQDIDTLQGREAWIKKMYKKHGGSYASMMTKKEEYLSKIEMILHRQDIFEKLEKELSIAKTNYIEKAILLSKQRQSVFSVLSQEIETHCHDLMLEHARFQIVRHEKNMSANGIDDIEFEASMNPGSDFTSLKGCASGGELSRFMLALKVVFQSKNGIQTMIFDEIDTGVSGKVALSMGQKMKALSCGYQVLCITHLASVACWADHHLRVFKESNETNTITDIELLDEQKTIEELALMTSGSTQEASLLAAKSLKEGCKL